MRRNIRNAKFLASCAFLISLSESLILTAGTDTSNSSGNEKKDERDVAIDAETKFKWIASGDMITKIPMERRLDEFNDSMPNDDEFYLGDIYDKRQPRSISGQDSFWELYDQLDSGKKPPLYKPEGNDSRPVLSKFRYIVVPIWWSDEDTSDSGKVIQTRVINDVMKYNKGYYERMSFGKFKFEPHIILSQTVIPVSSQKPGFGDLETAARNVASEEGYNPDVDYNGIVILYNVAKDGPFSGHGGWGTVNSDASVTWMSWRHGLSNDVARHEFGHNFGHPHHLTNGYKWRFGAEGVVGYDGYDMMSGGNAFDISDFALASKWFFGWVPNASVINMQPQGSSSGCPNCVSKGAYELYPFDGNDASKLMGIHIPVTRQGTTLYSYWLSYRSGNGAKAGLSVHISWFGNIGRGQFGASYDSLNYDAQGDTETRSDSFVLPETCYHIPPSVKMLEIDPIAALATQPVVCVTQLSEGNSIRIDVSFVKPALPTNDELVIECGTSTAFSVESNTDQLIHVDNTGVNGNLALTTSTSSGSAVAYIYDRYPISPISYSAPGGYGAFKSLNVPSGSEITEYTCVHNNAWILIKANSAVTFELTCLVNECQVGQKKMGDKCVPCNGNTEGCKQCPAGLEFLISVCVVSETVKEITESKKWRIWAPSYHTLRGWVWDVYDIKFYNEPDCSGTIFNAGTAINSGNAGGGWGPERVFDNNDNTAWGGRQDENNLFWVGMEFSESKNVQCVSIVDNITNGVVELRIQAWESSTNTWQNVNIAKSYKSGQRNDIRLQYPIAPSSSPSSTPSLGEPTTEKPTKVPTPVPTFAPIMTTGNPTMLPTNNLVYTGLRLWANQDMTTKGWAWDVYDVKLYKNLSCEGVFHNTGKAISSGHYDAPSYVPENAFDASMTSLWGGRGKGYPPEFWIGMDFETKTRNIQCVSLLDSAYHGATSVVVQGLVLNKYSKSEWTDIIKLDNIVPGERHYIPLNTIQTPTTNPTIQPTRVSPTTTTGAPISGEPTTAEPTGDICAAGEEDTCVSFGCIWKKNKCKACSVHSNKKKKKCLKDGCNWEADNSCQSCNSGENKDDCQAKSCVWKEVDGIGKMCTPCAAVTNRSKCKKGKCVWKGGKCASCVTIPKKADCKEQKKCSWSKSDGCIMKV